MRRRGAVDPINGAVRINHFVKTVRSSTLARFYTSLTQRQPNLDIRQGEKALMYVDANRLQPMPLWSRCLQLVLLASLIDIQVSPRSR